MANETYFKWQKALVLVTGASKGLGAVICEEFAKKIDPESQIVGFARSKEGLNETESRIKNVNRKIQVSPLIIISDFVSYKNSLVFRNKDRFISGDNVRV